MKGDGGEGGRGGEVNMVYSWFTCTFSHLADALIQSDLQ